MPHCFVYYEDQVEMQCGLHMTNFLLQGPWHTKKSFIKIGKKLDKLERERSPSLQNTDGRNCPDGQNANVQAPQRSVQRRGTNGGRTPILYACRRPFLSSACPSFASSLRSWSGRSTSTTSTCSTSASPRRAAPASPPRPTCTASTSQAPRGSPFWRTQSACQLPRCSGAGGSNPSHGGPDPQAEPLPRWAGAAVGRQGGAGGPTPPTVGRSRCSEGSGGQAEP